MTTTPFLRCSTWLVLLFLALGLVTPAYAKPASTPTADAAALLNDAYATLAHAKHDYKGHRVLAMKQIDAALGEAGAKVTSKGKAHEPQGTSDAQLKSAQDLVQQATSGLSGKALKHAKDALTELSTALAIK
jgi:hypothetical protein